MQLALSRIWRRPTKSIPLACNFQHQHFLSYDSRQNSHVELEYDLYGSETHTPGALVILHGLFGSKRNWMSLAKVFNQDLKRPIYAMDLRNHGTSPHAEPMDYSTMASDVLRFCEKHGLTNISLLGHSMGGKVAMAFALRDDLPPDLLSHLVIADIAPSKGELSLEFQGYVQAMKDIEHSEVTSRKEAQGILERIEKDPMTRAFLLTNLLPTEGEKDFLKFRVPLDIIGRSIPGLGSFPCEPGQAKWDGKTLFIKGSHSKYINDHNVPLAKEFFPNMILKSVPTGHWVHAERPKEFLDLVTQFISK